MNDNKRSNLMPNTYLKPFFNPYSRANIPVNYVVFIAPFHRWKCCYRNMNKSHSQYVEKVCHSNSMYYRMWRELASDSAIIDLWLLLFCSFIFYELPSNRLLCITKRHSLYLCASGRKSFTGELLNNICTCFGILYSHSHIDGSFVLAEIKPFTFANCI